MTSYSDEGNGQKQSGVTRPACFPSAVSEGPAPQFNPSAAVSYKAAGFELFRMSPSSLATRSKCRTLGAFTARTSAVSTLLACKRRPFSSTSSRLSSPAKTDDSKKYSQTLLLPKTSFPLYNDPEKSEVPFRKRASDDLYRWQVRATHMLKRFHADVAQSSGKMLKDLSLSFMTGHRTRTATYTWVS
jgi:hypothetical protein